MSKQERIEYILTHSPDYKTAGAATKQQARESLATKTDEELQALANESYYTGTYLDKFRNREGY